MWCIDNKLRRKDTGAELTLIFQRIFIANLKYHFPQDVYNRINSKFCLYLPRDLCAWKKRKNTDFFFFSFPSEQVLDAVIVPPTLAALSMQEPGVRCLFSLSKNPSPEWEQVLAHLFHITFSIALGRVWRWTQLLQWFTVICSLLSPELCMGFGRSAHLCSSLKQNLPSADAIISKSLAHEGCQVIQSPKKWLYFFWF